MRRTKPNQSCEFPFKSTNSHTEHQQQGKKSVQHIALEGKCRKTKTKKQFYDQNQQCEDETSDGQMVEKTRIPIKKSLKIERKSTARKNLIEIKSVLRDVSEKLKHKSPEYVPEYFVQNLKYMIEREEKAEWFYDRKIRFWRQILNDSYSEERKSNQEAKRIQRRLGLIKNEKQDKIVQNQEIKDINWSELYDNFALVIDGILSILLEARYSNSVFPCCYFFYMFLISDPNALNAIKKDNFLQEKLCYHIITSILASTKYHEIYPFSLEDIIENVNQTAKVKKILKHESILYQMNSFTEFYTDNQGTFMKMFAVILEWKDIHLQNCLYILESGLNNPQLYEERPSYKASAVCVMYEKMKFGGIDKSEIIRELTGVPRRKQMRIVRKYMKSLDYNKVNHIFTQKRKFFISSDFE